MKKIEQNKKNKKEALLQSAYHLFTTLGVHKTSVADISAGAGIAKSTFYLYFKDKGAIQNALIAEQSNRLFLQAVHRLLQQPEWSDASVPNKILFIVDDILDALAKDTVLLRFLSKNLSFGLLHAHFDEPREDFWQIFQQMLSKSPQTFRDPEIMISLIIELVNSACCNAILYHQPTDIETLRPHLYAAIRLLIENYRIN